MPNQIDTSTVATATGTTASPLVVIAPSDNSAVVMYNNGTTPKRANAASPYTSWTLLSFGATGGKNGQAIHVNSDDSLDVLAASDANGSIWFNYTRTAGTWNYANSATATADVATAASATSYFIGKDAQSRLWALALDDVATPYIFGCVYSTNGTTWTAATPDGTSLGETNYGGLAAAFVGNYLVVIYDSGTGALSYRRIDASQVTLGAWSAAAAVTGVSDFTSSSAMSLRSIPGGSTGMLAYNGTGGIKALVYNATTDTWGTVAVLSTSTNDRHPTLISGGAGVVYAVWCQYAALNSYALVGQAYNGSWGNVVTLESSGNNIAWPNGAYLSGAGQLALVWTQGTASPYSVQFDNPTAPAASTATQIDTSTDGGVASPVSDITAAPAASQVVVAPSDASLNALYFGSTGPKLATAQSPYSSWSTQGIGAATTRNSQAMIGHAADDSLQLVVSSPASGPYYFTGARSVNTWTLTAVGATGDTNNAGALGISAAMWTGLDPQSRFWYIGVDDVAAGYVLACGHYNGTAWTIDTTIDGLALGEQNHRGMAAAIIGNYLVVVYDSGTGHLSYRRLDVSQVTLGAWSAATQVGTLADVTTASTLAFRTIPGSSTGLLIYTGTNGISYLVYNATGDTWGAAAVLSASTNDRHPSIISGATGVVYAVWGQYVAANSYALVGAAYNGGWGATTTLEASANNNIAWPSGAYLSGTGKLALIWTQGAASPWSVQFDAVTAPATGGSVAFPAVTGGMVATLAGAVTPPAVTLSAVTGGTVATFAGALTTPAVALPTASGGVVATFTGALTPPVAILPAVTGGAVTSLAGQLGFLAAQLPAVSGGMVATLAGSILSSLRANNNPYDEITVMTALADVLVGNTRLEASGGVIYINDRSDIEMARAKYPTCVLESGNEVESKITWRTWKNRLTVKLAYIDRWDTRPGVTVSDIRRSLRNDLDLMLSNLRDNGNLVVLSTAHALRVSRITVSGYGSQGDKSSPVQTISCHAVIELELPPYISAL